VAAANVSAPMVSHEHPRFSDYSVLMG